MNRRQLLQSTASAALLVLAGTRGLAAAQRPAGRVRPGSPGWPSEAQWQGLSSQMGGRLQPVRSPLSQCASGGSAADCAALFQRLKNPYFIGDEPGLTQSLGWTDAWTSQPSVYAVAAESTADVVAAVNFARTHNLRVAVKGGGHSYQGTSNAPNSLLIWTRRMNAIRLHDDFVGQGCEGRAAPQPAVSIGAGAMWGQAYREVAVRGGRYVQGGGCLTVGVAGLVQSGGFGSFSKGFGSAAASLLEAEIVTADGVVRIANSCTNPDLYWALKGGGGGSFGVVTRVTLRTHDLPATVGAVFGDIQAATDEAWRALVGRVIDHYADTLFNPHWGEQLIFRSRRRLSLSMTFQGLDRGQAEAAWRDFFAWVNDGANGCAFTAPPNILTIPARQFWDVEFLRTLPNVVLPDDRPGAPPTNMFWAGNRGEAGQVLHGYQSAWLPQGLLAPAARGRLADAIVAAAGQWQIALHINKGLAGAPASAIAATRDTATNPAALDAFALVICAAEEPPAWPGIAGHEPDVARGRADAAAIERAMAPMRRVAPGAGSYVSESNYFERDWQRSFWGGHYPRLLAVKDRYDPDGLFIVHHGVGSERWSADGFTRV
jgi:FAD/FMN-containing dehydrogenase